MFKILNNLKIFFNEPNREFNVREVARILKMSPATASTRLKELKNNKLVIERKDRGFNFYKANLESSYYKDLKVFYNIRLLKDSGLIKALNEFYLKPTIILFGSVSFGLDTETSDIDLVIISEKKQEFSELKTFNRKLQKNIQIFLVNNIKGLKNKHLLNNVLNGIVIEGKVKWT